MKAAIDIGSNTVLLLVGTIEEEKVTVICEEQRAPRLGKGVDAEMNLDEASMDRALAALREFRAILDKEYPTIEKVDVVATSAVRDANNRDAFIKRVQDETGFEVQLASGEEEAALTFTGAKSVLSLQEKQEIAVMDIGGGSTEIAIGCDRLDDRHSYNIGSVRFNERYLKHDPPTTDELKACREAIQSAFAQRPFSIPEDISLIGVAGTVTSFAAINTGLAEYDAQKLNGLVLKDDEIDTLINRFSEVPSDELLEKYPAFLKGRSDVFVAGLLILQGFMSYYGISKVVASTGGIRHGALLMH